MATQLIGGQRQWSMTRDEQGHREYKISHLVKCDVTDGPYNALATTGLPIPGSVWSFDDDEDIWAWCRWDAEVTPLLTEDVNTFFEITQTFSSKPLAICTEGNIEDPLLQPVKLSGTFTKFTEEATYDRYGIPITSSSYEQIRGPAVEFDNNRPMVTIEFNVLFLDLGLISSMVDTVNAFPMWGLPARTIKLSNFSWEKLYYALCYFYFKVTLEFEINYNTFDRSVLDEGTKALNGHWNTSTGAWVLDNINGEAPNPYNPSHYNRVKDKSGENMRVILDGAGKPYTTENETRRFYCIVDEDFNTTCFEGTCYEALSYDLEATVFGPYNTEEECNVACAEAVFDGEGNITLCSPDSMPGSRFIQRYPGSNFLLLGIPMFLY